MCDSKQPLNGADSAAPPQRFPEELHGRVGMCREHRSAAEFYEDGSGQCLHCCYVETTCHCTEQKD